MTVAEEPRWTFWLRALVWLVGAATAVLLVNLMADVFRSLPAPEKASPRAVIAGKETATKEPQGYVLSVTKEAASAEAGALVVKLSSVAGFHLNTDFPARLLISAKPEAGIAKGEYGKSEFVPFTAQEQSLRIPYKRARPCEVNYTLFFGLCVLAENGSTKSCHLVSEHGRMAL